MKPGATRLRKVPETAEELAEMPARASPDSAVASRAIPIDFRPVISAYRKRGRFQLRVEKMPQSARFSAGQNNGDGSWSLLLDELEDLVYFAPKTVAGDHTLAIRLIAKDETEAFTIALIDYTVRGDGEHVVPSSARATAPLPDEVRNELHQLKATLEARESELIQLRESAERMGVMLQQKLDAAVAQAQDGWKRDEAARLVAEKARLEEQFGNRLAEREMRTQALAEIAREQQASALRMLRQEFGATREALTARESELAASRTQLERVRKDWEAEIVAAKASAEAKAAQALKAAESEWQARADKMLAEITAGQGAASADVAKARMESEAALAALRAELAQARSQAQSDIVAAKDAAEAKAVAALAASETKAADALQAAQAQWRTQSDAALAELSAKLEAAAAEKPDPRIAHDLAHLRAELERQRKLAEADIASARRAAEAEARTAAQAQAATALKAAETDWQARSDKALAELTARLEETASTGNAALVREAKARDARVGELTAELERQKRQADADIAAAHRAAEGNAATALKAAETKAAAALKAAEADWRAQSDKALAEQAAKLRAAPPGTVDLRSHRDTRVADLGAEVERLRRQSETEIAGVKAAADLRAADALKAAQLEWQAQAESTLAAMTARAEAAEAALAAFGDPLAERDKQVEHLQGQVEYLQKWSEAEVAAVKVAAEAREVQLLKDAEAKWQAQSDAALAAARGEAAAAGLAAADTGKLMAERDEEIAHLRSEIERQAQTSEADMAAARAAANIAAGEKLKAAQVIWEQETAGALAKAGARFDAAEAALETERRAAAGRVNDDEYVHSLEREIKTLRATLVDREAAIVQTQATQEHIRLGTVRDAPGTRWQPLTNTRPVGDDPELLAKEKSNRQLLRDVGVVVMAAAAAVLLFPKLEAMLPDNVRWQIETVGGLFVPAETAAAPAPPPVVASSQPKVEHPILYASRSINVRAQPSTSATIVVNLKRGASVAILEKRGNWDRVEVSAPQGPAQQGWAFNTYLTDTDPAVAVSAPQAPTAAPMAQATTPASESVTPAPAATAPVAAAPEPSPAPAPVSAAPEAAAATQ